MSVAASRRARRLAAQQPRRGPALLALLLVAVLIAGAVAADLALPAAQPPTAEAVAVDPPASGTWFCPVTAAEEETAVVSVATASDDASTVTVVRYVDGAPQRGEPVEVTSAGQLDVVLDEGAASQPVAVEWAGGPAVVTWRVEGGDSMGAPCEPSAAPTWLITGFDTSARSRSTLHLFNPFGSTATARVTFGTPTGPVALVLTDSVSVPAGGTVELPLNDFEPEQPDLAVTVEVDTGRLVAQGALRLEPTENQPGPSGRTVLPGVTAPAESWSFPDAEQGEGSRSWLSVYNPGEREAAVELRVSDPLPEGAPLLGETSIPAGGVARVDLADASSAEAFGVSVDSVTELGVVVTRVTNATVDGAEGVAASSGGQPDQRWAIAGGGAADRDSAVAVYNPTAEPITVDVDAGADTPDSFTGVELAANGRVQLALSDVASDRVGIPVRARGTGPFVMGLRTRSPGENLRFWAAVAVPARVWEGPPTRPAVARDPLLPTRPLPAVTERALDDGSG
ncbi:MAG: DUF5719 family protein [Egibacteraceae bacterium]